MPKGTDLVTWNPRLGSTSDNRYRFPDNEIISVGPSDIYSSIPTLAEVNSGSGINQIIAEYNRRIEPYLIGNIIPIGNSRPTFLSYYSEDEIINYLDYNNLHDVIGGVAGSGPVSPEEIILGSELPIIQWSSLRKTLAIDYHVFNMKSSFYNGYEGMLVKNLVTEDEVNSDGGTAITQQSDFCGIEERVSIEPRKWIRYRVVCGFSPSVSGPAELSFIFRDYRDLTTVMEIRESTTDLSSGSGKIEPSDWGNTIGSLKYSETLNNLTLGVREDADVGSVTSGSNFFYTFTDSIESQNNISASDFQYNINTPWSASGIRKHLFLKVY